MIQQISFGLWILTLACQAETPDNTLRVVADSMDCDQTQGICVATGNAFAERPQDPDKRTIRANKFTVYFSKSPSKTSESDDKTSKTNLKEIHADGNVVITDRENIIRSNKAVYHDDSETVELFDDVRLTQGTNQLNGSYGYADLKTKKYRVTNKESQVEGLFVKKPVKK